MISKKKENLIHSLYTRHGRKKYNLSVCEGIRAVEEVIKRIPKLIEFIVFDESIEECAELAVLANVDMSPVTASQLKQLSASVSPQGILAVIQKPKYKINTKDLPFALLLDKISDPGNFGTILRTAKSIGLNSVFFTKGSVNPYNEKVIRSAMGAQFSMNLFEFENIDKAVCELRKHNFKSIYATNPHAGKPLFEIDDLYEKSIIIFGGEANGLNNIKIPNSKNVTIPMPGNYESINLAQATTVFLFEYVRRY